MSLLITTLHLYGRERERESNNTNVFQTEPGNSSNNSPPFCLILPQFSYNIQLSLLFSVTWREKESLITGKAIA